MCYLQLTVGPLTFSRSSMRAQSDAASYEAQATDDSGAAVRAGQGDRNFQVIVRTEGNPATETGRQSDKQSRPRPTARSRRQRRKSQHCQIGLRLNDFQFYGWINGPQRTKAIAVHRCRPCASSGACVTILAVYDG